MKPVVKKSVFTRGCARGEFGTEEGKKILQKRIKSKVEQSRIEC